MTLIHDLDSISTSVTVKVLQLSNLAALVDSSVPPPPPAWRGWGYSTATVWSKDNKQRLAGTGGRLLDT